MWVPAAATSTLYPLKMYGTWQKVARTEKIDLRNGFELAQSQFRYYMLSPNSIRDFSSTTPNTEIRYGKDFMRFVILTLTFPSTFEDYIVFEALSVSLD